MKTLSEAATEYKNEIEILGSMSERARLLLEAKVPLAAKRSTCTLSTLYDLRAAIAEQAQRFVERTMSGEASLTNNIEKQPLKFRIK